MPSGRKMYFVTGPDHRARYERTCVACGKEFRDDNAYVKYCSKACRPHTGGRRRIPEEVRVRIANLLVEGVRQHEVAVMVGLSRSTVNRIAIETIGRRGQK